MEWLVPRLLGDPLPWGMLAGDFSPVSTECHEARASWGYKGLTPREGPGLESELGLICGCLHSAIKSKRDRASVQDSRRQRCAQVHAFRRACFGSGELCLVSVTGV